MEAAPYHTLRPDVPEPMPALDALRTRVDIRAGIRERFVTASIGGGLTIGVLATPLGEARSTGWVICHSFGMEQVNLQTHEVPLARAIAAVGYPVLRFHGQGYGDSERSSFETTLSSHVRDAEAAADVLVSETGVERIGLFGARLGGAVAALVGDQLGAESIAMCDPVVTGRWYANMMLRLALAQQLMHGQRHDGPAPNLERQIREQGFVDVQGVPLTEQALDEIRSLDIVSRLGAFAGRSLILRVARDDQRTDELEGLAERLRFLGGSCTIETIADERPNVFGVEPRFKPFGPTGKIDTQAELGQALVSATVRWLAEGSVPSGDAA